MTPHPESKYSNDNPPWKDPEWVYVPALNTNIASKIEEVLCNDMLWSEA